MEKTFTIYDNTDGGYTIWYKYFDKYRNDYQKKKMVVTNKESMLMWKRKLENDNYKFVGKI